MKTIQVNNNEYTFFNQSFSNSRSWGHESTLYKNGYKLDATRVYYHNRTWDSYEFQNVMTILVEEHLDALRDDAMARYKSDHGIKRLAGAKRVEFLQSFDAENTELYELIRSL